MCCRSSSTPSRATCMRRLPSNENGSVTTPTVRICRALAIRATTGAAPVPVPPPMPAAMNTMCAPANACSISLAVSSAAFVPTSGRAPAPNPRVMSFPNSILWSALLRWSALRSVLQITISTWRMPTSTILVTTLPPAPPAPKTLILGMNASCTERNARDFGSSVLRPGLVIAGSIIAIS